MPQTQENNPMPTKYEMDHWRKIASDNINRHLGDVVDADTPANKIYEEAWTLAWDALVDAGCAESLAGIVAAETVAAEVCAPYATQTQES
jgi:uncharacterized protein YbjT (DUF2867 family)